MSRVDRVVVKPSGPIRRLLHMGPRLRVLKGTPCETASLDSLDGAVPVPVGWAHQADVLVLDGGAVRIRLVDPRGPIACQTLENTPPAAAGEAA